MPELTPDESSLPVLPAAEKSPPNVKMPSRIAFAVGIVLFFMPFVDIQCNNMSLQKVSGAELATGFKIKGPGTENSLFDGLNTENSDIKINTSNTDKKDPNVFALAALALGALGLLLSISNAKAGGIGGVVTGSLAAAALVGLLIDVRRQLKADIKMPDTQAGVSIAVEFTAWFYIAVVAFIAAAYFSYKRMKA